MLTEEGEPIVKWPATQAVRRLVLGLLIGIPVRYLYTSKAAHRA